MIAPSLAEGTYQNNRIPLCIIYSLYDNHSVVDLKFRASLCPAHQAQLVRSRAGLAFYPVRPTLYVLIGRAPGAYVASLCCSVSVCPAIRVLSITAVSLSLGCWGLFVCVR